MQYGYFDDPLWLALGIAAYLNETRDWSILEDIGWDDLVLAGVK